ncbi:MAG: hypothetical protein R3F38_03785 [Gammaproteobacteria bacterium]
MPTQLPRQRRRQSIQRAKSMLMKHMGQQGFFRMGIDAVKNSGPVR